MTENFNKLLISFEEVIANTRIEKAVDHQSLRPVLLHAQMADLEELIDEPLYNFLLSARTAIDTYDSTVTGSSVMNVFVEDYMKPFLMAACVLEFIRSNNFHLANIGITVTTSTETRSATEAELKKQEQLALGKMNRFAMRMKKYICNTDNWPTFQAFYQGQQTNVFVNLKVAQGGIYFPTGNEGHSRWTEYNI